MLLSEHVRFEMDSIDEFGVANSAGEMTCRQIKQSSLLGDLDGYRYTLEILIGCGYRFVK